MSTPVRMATAMVPMLISIPTTSATKMATTPYHRPLPSMFMLAPRGMVRSDTSLRRCSPSSHVRMDTGIVAAVEQVEKLVVHTGAMVFQKVKGFFRVPMA